MPASENPSASPPSRPAILFWTFCLAAPLPGLIMYVRGLWDLEQYGYVLPLLAAVVAFVFFRWDRVVRLPAFPIGMVLAFVGLSMTALAVYANSPWLSCLGFVAIGFAWLHSHLAESEDRQRLTYIGLLLLPLIRLPLNYDMSLTAYLQRITSRISSHILDSLGIVNHLRGNVIDLPSGTLFIEEACSGVQSLFTVLFLACLLVVFFRRPIVTAPAYLIAAMGWAMVMNVIRITAVAFFQERYAMDLSKGTPHEILGWICLSVAVLMLLSTDRFLRVAFSAIPTKAGAQFENPVIRLWNRLLVIDSPETRRDNDDPVMVKRLSSGLSFGHGSVRAMLIAAALVCLPSVAVGSKSLISSFGQVDLRGSDELLWSPPADLLKATPWDRFVTAHKAARGTNSKQLGANSDAWTVVLDGVALRIAISQPYPEWHDLRICYEGNGWQLNDSDLDVSLPADLGERWGLSRAEFVREAGGFGHLLFSALDLNGNLIQPHKRELKQMWGQRWKDRSAMPSRTIMLQLWVQTETPLSAAQTRQMQQLFLDFRSAARDAVSAQGQ